MAVVAEPNVNVGGMFLRRADLTPYRPAITFEGTTTTHGDWAARTRALAGALKAGGVRRGDRVGFLGFNHPAFLETMFAATSLGAIFTPLNFRLTGPELEFVVNDAGLHSLVADAPHRPVIDGVRDKLCLRRYYVSEGETDGWTPVEAAMADAEPIGEPARVAQSETAVIMYTSGTTGRPKGAMLTHGNFFWNNMNANLAPQDMASSPFLGVAPLFHIGGLNCGLLSCIHKGGHVILHRNFDPAAALADIAEFRVRSMFGVPAMFNFMSQTPDWETADLSSLELLVCGGAPVPEPLIRLYAGRGVAFCQGYGLTETTPFASILGSDRIAEKVGSAGLPPTFTEIRIVDAENKPVGPREKGEVCIRGPNVMAGYWNRPEATAEAIDAEGWFHSGDIGWRDEEGYLYISDRLKDMVITGGENVYPAEVESVLAGHPAIGEVAVIGLPDEKWGEAVTAVAALKPGAELSLEELRAFAGDSLARYKLPLHLFTVDALPRNPAGKVLKFELRDRFAEG